MLNIASAAASPFGDGSLQSAVNKALNQPDAVPAGHNGAFLITGNTYGVSVILATRFGDHWGVTLQAQHAWSGKPEDITAELQVKATW